MVMARQLVKFLVLLVLGSSVSAADKDGFNLFKDYLLRGKNDDLSDEAMLRDSVLAPKSLYFYRASPSLLLPVLGDLIDNSELMNQKSSLYGKRAANQFKNYMLTREPPEFLSEINGPFADRTRGMLTEMLTSGRPIPVRSSVIVKRDVTHAAHDAKGDAKRAVFSWTVTSHDPSLQIPFSDFYTAMSPATTSLLDQLTSKSK